MMTVDLELVRRVRRWMGKFRYKDGWEFTVDVQRIVGVRWSFEARDVVTGIVDRVHGVMSVHPCFGELPEVEAEEAFWEVLRSTLHENECHESDEWFSVDGKRMFDPHLPKPRQKKGQRA